MQSSCVQVGVALQPDSLARTLPSRRPALRCLPAAEAPRCSTCRVRKHCLPGVGADDSMPVDELVVTRKRIHAGAHLFRAGDPFDSLYAFRSGFFKSYLVTADGRTQVTGFPMAGDCVGMDAIGSGTHTQNVVALETCEVCVIPYARLQGLCSSSPALLQQVSRMMSREIVREQQIIMLLGTLQAEAKVAEFLLSLSGRFAARGYSSTEFNLWMTRCEIGSYLGLQLETVSRVLSKLHKLGAIQAQMRHITIVNRDVLRSITIEDRKQRLEDVGRPAAAAASC